MDIIFDRIAIYQEKLESLKSKVKKALFYPSVVVVVAIIVTGILLLFVIPQFEDIFKSFGAQLPAFTRWVIGLSQLLQHSWYWIIGVIGLGGYAYLVAWRRMPKIKQMTDRLLLRIPVLGGILEKAAVARFARTLATTFTAGLPLIDGLTASAGAAGNFVYKSAVLDIRNKVSSGMQINVAMRTVNLFPDMVIQMIMIGEESGDLDGMLARVAGIYEQEVDDLVEGLTSLLEPMIMVVLGIIVGGLVIAMYLPIFELGSVVK